ncbi:MAG TPA: adenylyl-sulfate kinase [Planctomycetota bacterium]|nr:adenylyl-sulfate kinase [Planctomycetota bacterium]
MQLLPTVSTTPNALPGELHDAAHPQTRAVTEQMKIVIVGHVDHGKSTLIGRLFHDTDSLPVGKYEAILASCKKRGVEFEWAFLMDAFQAERDQNITIDTAQIWFYTNKRQYVIIDAPGHKEFLKNMISGAARAEAALLLIDAKEGVREQTRRHGYLLQLLGVRQVAVIINKMDLVDYSEAAYNALVKEYTEFLKKLDVTPKFFIPVTARHGENIARRSEHMAWYKGPVVLEALDTFNPVVGNAELPLRFPIQDVYRFDHRRILAGRVESGRIKVGDELIFAPYLKTSKVASIEHWAGKTLTEAVAGESIGITMTEQIFVERGQIGAHAVDGPVATTEFQARIFWLGREPLALKKKYKLKLATQEVECSIKAIDKIIDASTLEMASSQRDKVERNEVAELRIHTRYPLAVDSYSMIPETGRFVIVDGKEVAGGGIISGGILADRSLSTTKTGTNLTWSPSKVTQSQRAIRNGHTGGVVWLTGFSGAGKSTIANELEKILFERGLHTFALDGDNTRHGLCSDLGFSAEDRAENIRRVGHVVRLMAESGAIVVTSFISPYRADRRKVREIMNEMKFIEVYVKCPIEVCEQRDPKQLYRKARSGQIKNFTGIDAPYEIPENAEIVIETDKQSVEASVTQILDYLRDVLYTEKH